MQTRYYIVTPKTTPLMHKDARIIEATSAAQAVRFAVKGLFDVRTASAKDIVELVETGAKAEKATDETNAP